MIRVTALFFLLMGSVAGPVCAQSAPGSGTYGDKGADYWTGELGNEDYLVRLRAAYALGQIVPPTKAAVPRLAELLQDGRLEVRCYALHALGRIGPDAAGAVPAIVASFQDPDNDRYVRHCAAEALGRMGPVAKASEPVLLQALKSPDLTFRVEAATALWKISRYEAALPVLLAVLRTGEGDAAYQAAMALLEFGAEAKSAIPDLIGALKSSDPDVRRAAVKVIGGLGPGAVAPVARALKQAPAVDRRAAADALGLLLGEIREKVFYNPTTSETQFREVEGALHREVVPVLRRLLIDDDPEVRVAAGRALARMGPSTASELLAALRSDDSRVRQAAFDALGQFESYLLGPSTASALSAALRSENSRFRQRLRQAAFDALVRLESYLPQAASVSAGLENVKRETFPELLKTLQHENAQVREAALRIFVALEIGSYGRRAAPALRQFLQRTEDRRVRSDAARALKRLEQNSVP